jgi:hypothetical protein
MKILAMRFTSSPYCSLQHTVPKHSLAFWSDKIHSDRRGGDILELTKRRGAMSDCPADTELNSPFRDLGQETSCEREYKGTDKTREL